MIIRSTSRKGFILGKPLMRGVHCKEKVGYQIRLEKAFILTLIIFIGIFTAFRHMPKKRLKKADFANIIFTTIDMIPPTTQGNLSRPKDLPMVPIPTEDEFLPDDLTIENTVLDQFESIPLFDFPFGSGVNGVAPRPIREVIPEYPEELQKKGIEGVVELDILVNQSGRVDSVMVVRNTTGSLALERSAVDAAYRSRYFPAKNSNRVISRWIRRPYWFESN
jgi:TonB family protein